MSGARIPLGALAPAAIAAIALAIGLAAWTAAVDPNGLPRRAFDRYVAYLERKLRLMFVFTRGETIAAVQGVALLGVVACALFFRVPSAAAGVVAVAVAPAMAIERMRRKRLAELEDQLDGFLLALANALKSTPSIGDAFQSVQTLVAPPLRQEVELAVKEMRLGSTLDQTMLGMASRVGSKQLDSALSAILIGRQIGGNLPKILETTAATMREMARLEGVLRTKTAEGRAQLWVLALVPFGLTWALNALSEGYFEPLNSSIVGWVIAIAAAGFWLASLVVARRVLRVDL